MLFDGPIPSLVEQNDLTTAGDFSPDRPQTILRLASGQTLVLPTELLLSAAGDAISMRTGTASTSPASVTDETTLRTGTAASIQPASAGYAPSLETGNALTQSASARTAPPGGTRLSPAEQVIPLTEEQAKVGKREIETGRVRIQRGTETFNQTVNLPLTRTTYDVQRIPVGQLLPDRPDVRQEGDTTVYPLVEERFVAKREYFLVEEVHVRRIRQTTDGTATLELQRDTLSVEREPLNPDLR